MVQLVVILFGCQESVGKLKILFFIFLLARLRHNIRHRLSVEGNFGNFREISRYFLPVQPALRIQNLSNFFYIKKHKMLFGNLIMIAGKGCVFQPGSKIVDLGFVKFKSSGTKAKRPLERIQKAQGAKIKKFRL